MGGGTCWDGSIEPFQSYETITALRNELVYFKAQFLGKDETPNNKITNLVQQLGIKSDASFIEDDSSSWVYDLLCNKELGIWVYEKVQPFYENTYNLLLGKT